MHNVTADQIERNKQLIALVKNYPQIYNHDPTIQSGESLDEIWKTVGQEMGEGPDVCKKKWRLLRSSLIRYIKVFKDKSTSKGNRYRPYYLLEHMDFLLPFIDDKNIIRKIKHEMIKSPSTPTSSPTTTVVIKKRPVEQQEETILYTNSTPITYSVHALSSSKDSQENKEQNNQSSQDIQQFYNHAGVKIIGEDYISYPTADGQLQIYQTASGSVEELHQQQQQESMQQSHDGDQSEIHNESKQQTLTNATIIPIPNAPNIFSNNSNPNEASDIYFLLGLLPDFRNLNNDIKRKVKIGMLKLLDDAVSN